MPIGELWDSEKLSLHFYPLEDTWVVKSLEHLAFLAAFYNLKERILPSFTRHLISKTIFDRPSPTQFLMTMFIIFPQIHKTVDPFQFLKKGEKQKYNSSCVDFYNKYDMLFRLDPCEFFTLTTTCLGLRKGKTDRCDICKMVRNPMHGYTINFSFGLRDVLRRLSRKQTDRHTVYRPVILNFTNKFENKVDELCAKINVCH